MDNLTRIAQKEECMDKLLERIINVLIGMQVKGARACKTLLKESEEAGSANKPEIIAKIKECIAKAQKAGEKLEHAADFDKVLRDIAGNFEHWRFMALRHLNSALSKLEEEWKPKERK